MSEPKLCPFCGPHDYFKPEMHINPNGHHDIVCPQCGAAKWCEIWNRRPIEDALRARVERLKAALRDIQTNHQHVEYVYDRASEALEGGEHGDA